MGTKKRSVVLDYTVYVVVRCLACLIQILSWRSARTVSGWLAGLVYFIDKRHRHVAAENLRLAFPGQYTEKEIDQIVRNVYRHFCMLMMEICLIPRKLRVYNYKHYLGMRGEEQMVRAMLGERPVLIVTGHLGNWELAGYFMGLCGFTLYAVARTLDNPYLDQYLRGFREKTGQRILAKKGDFDQMTQVLANGGRMATLGDQDAGQRGLFVEFFGRPASTHKAIALMALEYQVPIVVSAAIKLGEPLRYQIIAEEIIYPEDYANQPDAVRQITQRYTTALERLIRRAPEQYFWLHNRWKSQPAKARKKAA
jgi:KDO2-lipid IV(A) lauroyltransferase